MSGFITYSNEKLFSHDLKILIFDGLWKKPKNCRMKFDT